MSTVRIELTGSHAALREEVRAWATKTLVGRAGDFDRAAELPEDVVDSLRDHRLLGSTVGEPHGGRGLDMVSYGLVHEEIGAACSSTRTLLTVHDMVAHTVERLGPSMLRERWLPELATGSAIAAFALSEPEVGSDAGAVRTIARDEGDDFVLNGEKRWTSFGRRADVFLVVAREEPGGQVGGFLVPRGTPGLDVRPMQGLLGLRASMLAELTLRDCRLPAESRLRSAGLPGVVAATALQLGRYSVAWGCVGVAGACVAASYDYAATRKQFGVPIRDHQLVRRHLARMWTDLEAARLMCLYAGSLMDTGDPRAVASTLTAKYFASQAAFRIANDTLQVHGAEGCRPDSDVERYFRDARMMEIIEGTTEILETVIPRYGPSKQPRADAVED